MSNKARKRRAKTRTSQAAGKPRRPVASGRPAAGEEWRSAVQTLVAEQVTPGTAKPAEKAPREAPSGGNGAERSAPRPAAAQRAEQAALGGCAGLMAEVEPQAVAATYVFDLGEDAPDRPFDLAVRFTGVRTDATGLRGPRDRFERIERVEAVPARTRRVAVTGRVEGVNAGPWRVTAAPVQQPGRQRRETTTTHSRFGVLAHGPNVRLSAWPALVGLGALLAIALQLILGARAGLDVGDVIVLSAVACVVGLLGGKAWYLVLNRAHPRRALSAGMCVQGFLVGAVVSLVAGAGILGMPIGSLLDVTTPGILFAVAIGRPGCWLTGCCAGRPTASRWGLWSSDRRLAIRRAPVQLAEATLGLVLGVVSLALVLTGAAAFGGQIFVAVLAAYTLGRQPLFLMRADSHTPRGRALTIAGCAAVLAIALVAPLFM